MSEQADRKPIIVGVDGSPTSIDALRKAAEIGQFTGAPLEAITAWQFPFGYDGTFSPEVWSPEEDAKRVLGSAIAEAFGAERPEGLTSMTIPGPAAPVLIKRSENATMLVLGSRGRGGFAGLLLGSVSTACAQHAHCPVLIMHSAERPKNEADKAASDTQSLTAV